MPLLHPKLLPNMPLLLLLLFLLPLASGDPQTTPVDSGCSQYNVSNRSSFPSTLNSTFSNLKSQLNSSSLFATVDRPPLYSLFYCRPYLSLSDCLLCFAAAATKIRSCGLSNGARVIFDGCFLRYESARFFDQATALGNGGLCNNRTDGSPNFKTLADGLMSDLSVVTSKVEGFFAAAERGGVYGVAQCARTVSESGCADCLAVAYANVKGCPPDSNGRAYDAGCFMRYSSADFFGKYQTVDLEALLASLGITNHQNSIHRKEHSWKQLRSI